MNQRPLVTVNDAQDTLHSAETSTTPTGQWSNNYVSQLAHTVIAQAEQIETLSSLLAGAEKAAIDRSEQIKRLQKGIKELEEWDGKDYTAHLIYLGIITEQDMEATDD